MRYQEEAEAQGSHHCANEYSGEPLRLVSNLGESCESLSQESLEMVFWGLLGGNNPSFVVPAPGFTGFLPPRTHAAGRSSSKGSELITFRRVWHWGQVTC